MPAIDFRLTKGKRYREWLDRFISFDEKIHMHLCNMERNNASMRLLLDLDQYGDKLFSEKEIMELHSISEYLFNKYQSQYDRMEKDIRGFAMELKSICFEAIEKNLLIISLGD